MITLRPGTMDEYVWNEVRCYDPLGITSDDLVLDLGANIGAFAYRAAAEFGACVTGYEPDPDNAELARQNTEGWPVRIEQAAVSGNDALAQRAFYRSTGPNKGSHTIIEPKRDTGRERMFVSSVPWRDVCRDQQWDIVKCDIEGAEYELDWSLLPDSVRAIAVELHLNRKTWRSYTAPLLVTLLQALRFEPVKEPKITENNWHTVGIWRRDV